MNAHCDEEGVVPSLPLVSGHKPLNASLIRSGRAPGVSYRNATRKCRFLTYTRSANPVSLAKEALLDAVLDRSIGPWMTNGRQAAHTTPVDADPRLRLSVAIAPYLLFITEHGDFSLASRRAF